MLTYDSYWKRSSEFGRRIFACVAEYSGQGLPGSVASNLAVLPSRRAIQIDPVVALRSGQESFHNPLKGLGPGLLFYRKGFQD